MKAIVVVKRGSPDGLRLKEVEKPTPQANEVLIKIHAATVTAGDVVLRKFPAVFAIVLGLFGTPRKKTPGHEFAGDVEAVGSSVTQFKVGDPVFGTTTGLKVGANAEYVCVPESRRKGVLALKPANVSYEQAAAIPVGAMTALYILKQANIQGGQKVLVYGASGSVGSFAVQLAKAFGAEVTGVCSTANVEMVQSLGADDVIDYKREDFTTSGATYDVIFDAVGKLSSESGRNALTAGGHFLSVRTLTSESMEALLEIRELVEAGALKPFIDKRYPLEQTADAHRYVETGRKRGNVVITVTS